MGYNRPCRAAVSDVWDHLVRIAPGTNGALHPQKCCNDADEDQHLMVQVCRQQGAPAGTRQCQPTPSTLPDGHQPTPLCYAMRRTHFWPVEMTKPIVAFESQGTSPPTAALAQMGLWGAFSPGSSQLLPGGVTQGLNGAKRWREREKVFPYFILK